MHNTPQHHQKSLRLTKQAAGTLTKVASMIESDIYCPDIIQQIDAAIGLLRSTKKELLTGHLDHCLEDNLKANKEKTVKELVDIFKLNS
ncbi:MAG: csoR [Patescibacteria group bacterium]|jgi:DNA-binding FrmR family transcriptional regulator|nr:csoR [Patescibacteria group bacterium]